MKTDLAANPQKLAAGLPARKLLKHWSQKQIACLADLLTNRLEQHQSCRTGYLFCTKSGWPLHPLWVREHGMAAMNGIALHGGAIPMAVHS